MKPFRLLPIIGLLTMVLSIVVACTPAAKQSTVPTTSTFPLSIIDTNGKTITITKPPERIVAVDSAAVEILFAMGEGERVVGTHTFITYPPETADIEKIGDAFNMNFEKIAALKPDLVYVFYGKFVPDLEKLGIPVLYQEPPATLQGVAEQIRLWGKIIDRTEASERIARDFEDEIATIQQKVANITEGPRIYHDASIGLWTTGSGSLASEIYSVLKARNVFGDISGYKQVSAEELVARNPQVIISVFPEGPDQFKTDTVFKEIAAVKDGKIFYIDESLLSVPGPRLVDAIDQLAKLIYPQLFP